MNRKNVFLWTLYDFANSVPTIVFFLYFSQWLVVDHHVTDFWYNFILTAGSLLLLVTAPILGSVADKNGKEQQYLNWITIFTFLSFLGVGIIALFFPNKLVLAAGLFLLANYFYQFSFVFYNALLHYIAPKEKWGTISGIGQAGNWLGQIFGLAITLPLTTGAVYFFGEPGRAQTFIPTALIFIVLVLPMLLFFKSPREKNESIKINWKKEYKEYWNKFKDLISDKNMAYFLLSYFFFSDALITASNNFPIYLENVYKVPDTVKSFLLGGILVTSAIGAFLSGFIVDRFGLKKSMLVILASWVVTCLCIAFAPSFHFFVFLTIIMGLLFGSTWTVTRAIMTVLCPTEKLNFGFSFYTMAERVSTFIGPVSWGIVVLIFDAYGPFKYQVGILTMTGYIIIGFLLLQRVNIKGETI